MTTTKQEPMKIYEARCMQLDDGSVEEVILILMEEYLELLGSEQFFRYNVKEIREEQNER